MYMMENDIERVLITQDKLKKIVEDLGAQISRDYEGKELILVSVLKGSVVFMGDLMRAITIPCYIDFMSVSSYGNERVSSGKVRIVKDLDESIEDRDVLIVEDIIDSGRTLSHLLEMLGTRHPASIRLCTMLDKPSRREVDVKVDYVGFTIEDKFVLGYGLDYDQFYRNIPYIAVVE